MLSWAERHLERVEDAAEDFMRQKPYITSCDANMERRLPDALEYTFCVWLRQPVVEAPKDVPFLIGDVLHAMRVSLDYLAVHVVTKAVSGTDESKVAFPIIRDPADWGSAKGKLPGVSGRLFDAFKSVQPCFGSYSARPEEDPIAILDRLEQPHKHRRMLSALPGVYEFIPSIVDGDPKDVLCLHVTLPTRPLGKKEKAEIARYRIAAEGRPLEPKAYVQGKVRLFVCFDTEGPALGAPAITLLKKMRDRIRDDIFPQFEPFL